MPTVDVLLRLGLILLLCGGLAVVLAAMLMARLLLRPPRMNDGKAVYVLQRLSPADLGLAYESLTFDVPDAANPGAQLRLAAWWIPATTAGPSERTVVLLHGYADAKVGAIAWAPLLMSMNVNLVAIDLRAHGESEGEMTTAGFFERYDVDAAINQLKVRFPRQTQRLYLYGLSLGGAIAIATADVRDDIAGVVMDSTFADYAEALYVHSRLLGSPGWPVVPLAAKLAAWRAGVDFAAVRPVDLVARSRCPVLVIQGTTDPITDRDTIARYTTATTSSAGSQHLILKGVGHLAGFRDASEVYGEAVRSMVTAVERSQE